MKAHVRASHWFMLLFRFIFFFVFFFSFFFFVFFFLVRFLIGIGFMSMFCTYYLVFIKMKLLHLAKSRIFSGKGIPLVSITDSVSDSDSGFFFFFFGFAF
jgi:hypothetical protein